MAREWTSTATESDSHLTADARNNTSHVASMRVAEGSLLGTWATGRISSEDEGCEEHSEVPLAIDGTTSTAATVQAAGECFSSPDALLYIRLASVA